MRKFGVPYWAIARTFGRNTTFWYRLELSIGRNSVVGTTVKDNGKTTCPAERLNGKRYADNWLQNLFTAASLGGTKKLPLNVRND